MKPPGIELVTFWFVAQCLNQLGYCVPLYAGSTFIKNARKYSMTPHGATLTT
jgi:hypothetical protein